MTCPHGKNLCRPCEREAEAPHRTRRRDQEIGFAVAHAVADNAAFGATYSGRCTNCGDKIAEGQPIRRGPWGWQHDDCPES